VAYQDGDILVRAVMTNANGIAADTFVNDFAFTASLAQSDSQITELFARVNDFYRFADPVGGAIGGYISKSVSRAATHKLQAYRIAAGGLGSPIREDAWLGPSEELTGTGVVELPNEVAAVVSFHADLFGIAEEAGATRPKARRRGRLYIGPLNSQAITATSANPKLNTNLGASLRGGINRIIDANDDGGSGGSFAVWSRKDAQLRVVTGGWTDDAMDTQRRRGQKSTARVVFGS